MRHLTILILIGITLTALCNEPVIMHWSQYYDGRVYFATRPVPGVTMKPVKLKWADFTAKYKKSWIYDRENGWTSVDTPPAAPPASNESAQVEIPRYIPPIRNGREELIIVERPLISPAPSKR